MSVLNWTMEFKLPDRFAIDFIDDRMLLNMVPIEYNQVN